MFPLGKAGFDYYDEPLSKPAMLHRPIPTWPLPRRDVKAVLPVQYSPFSIKSGI